MLRGAAVVTRLLHGNRRTRQAVRLMPGIVDGAARTVLRAASGQPTRWRSAGCWAPRPRASCGRTCAQRGDAAPCPRAGARPPQVPRRLVRRALPPAWLRAVSSRNLLRRGWCLALPGAHAIRRQPVRVRTVGGPVRVPRPRPGIVRVVTPVRIPSRDGRPGRTVRVVSDVRVPRGAVPTGRPVSVGGTRRLHGR